MKLSRLGRATLATITSLAIGAGMTGCGGGTVAFLWVTSGKKVSNDAGNSITGFKVDDYTGNLTEMVRSPYSANGTNPVFAVLKPGGRYMYVVNKGDGTSSHAGAGVSLFSVGGDGVLTFQQNYTLPYPGTNTTPHVADVQSPVWVQMDNSGGYLYILASKAPINPDGTATPLGCGSFGNNCGALFVYAINGDTGRLTLQQNANVKVNGQAISYYPTGPNPFQARIAGGSYIFIANGAAAPNQSVTVYSTAGAGGALTLAGNVATQPTGTTEMTSITSGASYVYITDGATNQIYAYTVSNGTLAAVVGSPFKNFVDQVRPVWTVTENRGKYLYVVNNAPIGGSTTCTQNSTCNSISAFVINPSTGKLDRVNTNTNNPYPTGGGPTCMLQDPSNQYVYTSNTDGTVTGYLINPSTGELSSLRRGSTFSVTGQPTCLVASGATT